MMRAVEINARKVLALLRYISRAETPTAMSGRARVHPASHFGLMAVFCGAGGLWNVLDIAVMLIWVSNAAVSR